MKTLGMWIIVGSLLIIALFATGCMTEINGQLHDCLWTPDRGMVCEPIYKTATP